MNGILCLDKPQEMTSFLCCAVLRRLLKEKKVGHCGTLDPMATGVLPILVGRATRALDLLPVQDKRYTATFRFGFTSDTLDVWGQVSPTGKALPTLSEIEQVLPAFRGKILQIPPMISAIKQDGVRLYELARQGIEVSRASRPITIFALEILQYSPETGELTLDCLCSKGTYIRTLCDDLGQALYGVGAVMIALRRTMAAGYTPDRCMTLEAAKAFAESGQLEEQVLPIDTAFETYPALTVSTPQAHRFCNGGGLSLERLSMPITDTVRVYTPDNVFLGLGTPAEEELRILKLFF